MLGVDLAEKHFAVDQIVAREQKTVDKIEGICLKLKNAFVSN